MTADKGVFMVVMDWEEYIKKSEELLSQASYKVLPSDPTTKHKNKLIALLKTTKAEGESVTPSTKALSYRYIKRGSH